MKNMVYPAQLGTGSFGKLQVNVSTLADLKPIQNATISISFTGDPGNTIEEINTNVVGQTEAVELTTPPLEYSMKPSQDQPYAEYTISIRAEGFKTVEISGAEVLPDQTALQEVRMEPQKTAEGTGNTYVVPPHTLYGDYPPKIAEPEVKKTEESGEIVLAEVVIPEFVVVHDGPPTDQSANNYYVRYRDYIKNVASSEIYATWPETTIMANILAIQSFSLNRVYTEWYRNKGYNFTITSSTAFDHKWVPGRNVFANISTAVDTIFANYLSRPNIVQPILTQYCDGNRTQCPNWMTQWGSKYLGDKGYDPIGILRYFYGDTMYINNAQAVAGIPASFPKVNLSIGSSGESVRQMQNQLNVISNNYPLIPKVAADGQFGEKTAEAVRTFQSIFGLPSTGIVDYPTWYKISDIFVAVSRIAELV